MDERRDSSLYTKKSKAQKKVSFDTKVHRMNFAMKSTSTHHGVVQRRRIEMKNKRMVLQIAKCNITGYKVPIIPESGKCARLIPVEEVLSGLRTNAALHSANRENTKKRSVKSLTSSCMGTVDAVEPLCKKRKVREKNQVFESSNPEVQPLHNDKALSPDTPDCSAPISELAYDLKLNETIEKMIGKPTKKKKKRKKRYSDLLIYAKINILLCTDWSDIH